MKSNLIHFYNPVLHFTACAWVHTLWSVSPSHLLYSCSSYSHQPPSKYACWTLTAGKCSYTEFLLHSYYDEHVFFISFFLFFFQAQLSSGQSASITSAASALPPSTAFTMTASAAAAATDGSRMATATPAASEKQLVSLFASKMCQWS